MLNQIDLAGIDLNLLVLFEAVLEERNVGRAAGRLHVTPSAVSHGLGRLRELLNDPLFLRTPKGVVPTARASELAAPIADVLARTRNILEVAAPFDPATSKRRFTIGAPDGISAVLVPPLLATLAAAAPGIDVAVRQVLPRRGEHDPERAWSPVFAELDAHLLDLAIIPSAAIPARFERRHLFDEDFVIIVRAGHPFARAPSLARYCELQHLVVSQDGDPHGFIDDVLAKRGRSRRVAPTVPNFMMALAVVADTDLAAAVPRRFAAMYTARLAVRVVDAPVALGMFPLHAMAPQVALMDAGLAWLFDRLAAGKRVSARRR
jgi:DNA-binding transcriptional LysR family regulator